MYSGFVKVVLTYQGKKIIREHQCDKDAQKTYVEIYAHALKFKNYLINYSRLLTYIISTRVVYGSWCGTTESFILD